MVRPPSHEDLPGQTGFAAGVPCTCGLHETSYHEDGWAVQDYQPDQVTRIPCPRLPTPPPAAEPASIGAQGKFAAPLPSGIDGGSAAAVGRSFSLKEFQTRFLAPFVFNLLEEAVGASKSVLKEVFHLPFRVSDVQ